MEALSPLGRIEVKDELLVYIFDKHSGRIEKEDVDYQDAVTSWGKNQIALLLKDKTGLPINEIRYKKDGTWGTVTVTNSRNLNTLEVTSATITGAGTYTAFFCSNSGAGSNWHNSIGTNIVLGSNQELVVIMRWGFSGLSQSEGNYACASLLGSISDTYLATLDSFRINTPSGVQMIVVDKIVSNNTVTCSIPPGQELTTPGTYAAFYAYTRNQAGTTLGFHFFTGATVVLSSGQELNVRHDYIVG